MNRKHLPIVTCTILLFALLATTTAFTAKDADPSNQTSVKISESEHFKGQQVITVTDNKTNTVVTYFLLESSKIGGPITDADSTQIIWNPKRTAFAFHSRRPTKHFAMFVALDPKNPSTTSSHYFDDSHPAGYSQLTFKWISDTTLQASYNHANGKPWVEEWTIGPSQFACAPTIINGKPTTRRNP